MHISLNLNKILSFLIVLVPILNIYSIFFLPGGIGDTVLATMVLVLIFKDIRQKKKIGKCYFTAYYTVFFILSLASIVLRNQHDIVDFVQKWIRIIILAYIIDIAAKKQFDRDVLYKWSIRLGLIVSAILLLQVAAMAFFSIQIEPYIGSELFLLNGGNAVSSLVETHQRWNAWGMWRPSSIFSEPAHFAQFVLLSLVVSVFGTEDLLRNKRALGSSIIFSLALVLCESANGILVMLVIWGGYFARYLKKTITARQLIFAGVILCIAAIVILNTDYLDNAWTRVETVRNVSSATTGNQRLLQGFAVFKQLPAAAQWFGIGYGNVSAFLTENHVTTVFLSDLGNEYMNGFSTILVSSGIIGFVIYLFLWVRLFFENRSSVSRMALLVISILFCTSSLFYSTTTIMYLVFVRCRNEMSVKEKETSYGEKVAYIPWVEEIK